MSLIAAKHRLGALLLAASAILSMTAGCKQEKDAVSSASDSPVVTRIKASEWKNPLEPPDIAPKFQVTVPEENRQKMQEIKAQAPDVLAYLEVPGTSISDVVVQYSGDDLAYYRSNGEYYYERKDIYGNYKWEGCIFMDFENRIGLGSAEEMPQNVILYAHHLGNPQGITNDPNGAMFGPLLLFREQEFAEETPYIYLTTEKGDLVYEVFAAGDMQTVTRPVEYNLASYSVDDFMTLVEDMRSRSYFLYPDVEVSPGDKLLTLSTCIYDYGTYAQNRAQRFVVFARLVTDGRFSETANVVPNTNRVIPTW